MICAAIALAAIVVAIPLSEIAGALQEIRDILRRGGR